MIPSSVGTAIAFLLFIAPGAVWQWWRSRYRSTAKETVLTETARAALISVAASLVAAVLIGWWIWVPLYERTVSGDVLINDVVGIVAPKVFFATFLNSTVACVLAWLVAVACWHGPSTVTSMSVWTRSFSSFGRSPYLIVELLDGTIWRGKYIAHDLDIDSAVKNLSIGQPLQRRQPNEGLFHPKIGTTFVLLKEDSIKTVQVLYPEKGDDRS